MSALKNEQTLLNSNDGSITLTTHRVIEQSDSSNKEIMLSDFVSYEVINKKSNYYKTLSIIFFLTSAIFGIWSLVKKQDNQRLGSKLRDAFQLDSISNDQQMQIITGVFGFSVFLLFCSLVLFIRSGDKCLQINGKYNSLEFSVKDLRTQSLNKFIGTLLSESEKRKKE